MPSVFVNYRRTDAGGHAGRLYDALHQGDEFDVFMDVDNIPIGANFVDEIERALEGCDLVLAVIGPLWLHATDRRGRRRLDLSADHVRIELEAAMRLGIRLVPILVGGAEMPEEDELPPSLAPMALRNAFELRDTRWADDIYRLRQRLAEIDVTRVEARQVEKPPAPVDEGAGEIPADVLEIEMPEQAISADDALTPSPIASLPLSDESQEEETATPARAADEPEDCRSPVAVFGLPVATEAARELRSVRSARRPAARHPMPSLRVLAAGAVLTGFIALIIASVVEVWLSTT